MNVSTATAVKMGNAFDTSGASVAECVVLKDVSNVDGFLGKSYILATPMGIAHAGMVAHGVSIEYMYSTHCMPLSYHAWIKNNWGLEITPEITALVESLEYYKTNIKSDKEAEVMADTIAKAMARTFARAELIAAAV